ncbi:MAG TPA: UDP-N-acetylmuramate--L-alanine ligase [Thermoanaerobaculia bacterium]|jgi:UDP-N-acetylmuramate--alanine ligase|nr:UDP-N-acetylmuramate--L-alanine ligase [Thermoanaerobaculia bacterium]
MIFDQIRTIHFVGIGGIGMSGLAEILNGAGIRVTGCDLKPSSATDLLASRGIAVTIGHDASHVEGNDLIVITSAVRGEHPEVDAARMKGIRIMKRSEVLGAIVNEKRSIGVAGTHGKTTTSAMISVVLEEAGLDPTILVGGMVRNIKTNAKRGAGELLVVEADEYDRTFHHLHPEIAVVTNIEADHLEYYKTLENIHEAFRIFVGGIRKHGVVIGCCDDEDVARLLRHAEQRRVGYGLSEGADLRAVNLEFSERGSSFEVPGVGFFKLFIPGEHNVRNALAAIAVGRELGIDAELIASGLAKFLGVDRRFQILGSYQGAIVVDDYAHHPTEIRATLEAARGGYPDRRVVALFQPHLYSRTRDFAKEFGEAMRVADVPIIAPIYAAREQPIEGVSAKLITDATPGVEFLDRSHAQIVNELRRRLRPDDIFIAMGAGDVHEIAEQLVRGEDG